MKEGFASLFKNRLMTLASVATIASCVLLFIVSYCAIINVNFFLTQIESTVGISVFPVEDISDSHLELLEGNLNAIANVTSVRYISPEEALQSMEEDFGADSDVLKGFEKDNPLSKSFEVKVNAPENTKQVINDIKKLNNIRKIREAEQLVTLLINASNALSIIGVVVVVILGGISIVIVMNTIKLTVYVRRKEINIMKYVGATDWFIRWPFIIEGVFIGILGAAFPLALTVLAYTKIVDMAAEAPIVSELFTLLEAASIFPLLTCYCLFGGGLLGMFGSIYSVRKHLNV